MNLDGIFSKALEESGSVAPDAREKFAEIFGLKWLDKFVEANTLLREEYINLGLADLITKCVKSPIKKHHITTCRQPDLWQIFVQKCAQEGYPFLSLSFVITADILYQKLEGQSAGELNAFYARDAVRPDKYPHRAFLYDLMALAPDVLKLFSKLLPAFPLESDRGSAHLKELAQGMARALPAYTPPAVPVKAVEEPEKAAEKPSCRGEKPPPTKAAVGSGHPIFSTFELPSSLNTLCRAIAEKAEDKAVDGLLYDNRGLASWRDRFVKSLALVVWLLPRRDKEVGCVLRSLWDIVYLMGARDKKNVELNAPQDIVLALWEPALYSALVYLTIKALETFGDELTLQIDVANVVLNKSSIEKLRTHQLVLGCFIKD